MFKKPRPLFRFESLEQRVILSVAPNPLLGHVAAQVGHGHASRPTLLNGTIRTSFNLNDPSGTPMPLNGSGNVRPLGNVSANGSFVGQKEADVTLSNPQGSLSIKLIASAPPDKQGNVRGTAIIVGGTGAFAKFTGQGTASETAGPVNLKLGTVSENLNIRLPLKTS